VQFELKHAATFLVWPVIGFGAAVVGSWLALEWLAPLGVGRALLSLLARWPHLDAKVLSELK